VNKRCDVKRIKFPAASKLSWMFHTHTHSLFLLATSATWNYEGVSKSFRTGRLERELQMVKLSATGYTCTRVYPKVSGLAAWSENCKCYSSLPLVAVVSLFCEPF
jgi:hypothetical protein